MYDSIVSVSITTISLIAVLLTSITSIINLRKKAAKISFNDLSIDFSNKKSDTKREINQDTIIDEQQKESTVEEIPFEAQKLNDYYSQVLTQSKVSFWFSLLFASIGFAVIIIAAFSINNGYSNLFAIISGSIIEAVSSLFFVLSKQAQKSMNDFFEKLRLDRKHADSRQMCEEIKDEKIRDAIKVQLILHYANLPNSSSVADTILSKI